MLCLVTEEIKQSDGSKSDGSTGPGNNMLHLRCKEKISTDFNNFSQGVKSDAVFKSEESQ